MQIDAGNSRIFKDLVEYTKLPAELVIKRTQYAAIELAIKWYTKKSVDDYYKNNDLYIYDLTAYQLILEHGNHIKHMVDQIKDIKAKKVLEFGGGIGEFSIMCSDHDIPVTYFDLEGDIKKYALWRFKKHQSQIAIVDKDPLDQQWDVINIMDVLEHLEDPKPVLEKLRKNAKFIFCNPNEIKYNVFFPQHISKFSLDGFTHVKDYLWKNNSL